MSQEPAKGQPIPDSCPPPEVLQGLMVRWMECFVSAARAQSKPQFEALFHRNAVVFGGEKGGCVDWPLVLNFEFDIENAKIHPVGPCTLCIVDWSMKPVVIGGEAKRGHVTFFNTLQPDPATCKMTFECVHAHFSAINA